MSTDRTSASVAANGITLAYDSFGTDADETILLIAGLGTQMIRWTDPFCGALSPSRSARAPPEVRPGAHGLCRRGAGPGKFPAPALWPQPERGGWLSIRMKNCVRGTKIR